MKYYQIVIDGIDKSGKDCIKSYIYYLGKAKYICNARGYMSMVVYSDMYNRNYEYDVENQKNIVNILLTVDKEDWEIRCKTTNEPIRNYDKDTALFTNVFSNLLRTGYHVLTFNTSKETPYQIAKQIVDYMEKINNEESK